MKTHIKKPNVYNGEGATRSLAICGVPAREDAIAVDPAEATCENCNPAAMLRELGTEPLTVEDFVCEYVAEKMAETMSDAFERECACRMSSRDMRAVCLDMLKAGVLAARKLAADRAADNALEANRLSRPPS